MPRGGPPTYTYSLPAIYLAVPGTLITAAQHNTPLEDIATALNTAWPVNLGGTGGTSKQGAVDSLFDGTTSVDDDNLIIAYNGNGAIRFRFDASGFPVGTSIVSLPLGGDVGTVVETLRNRIVNHDMRISQQNGTSSGTTNGYYPVDQWSQNFVTSAGTLTVAQVASVTPQGSPNRLRATVTVADASLAAGEFWTITQNLEGSNVADFMYGSASAQDSVLRFGFKGPAGTYAVALHNSAVDRSYVALFTVAGGQANTDTVQTIAIAGDTTGTWLTADGVIGITLDIVLACGSTFQGATGWQAGNILGTSGVSNGMGTGSAVFELFDVGLRLDPDATGVYGQYQVGEVHPVWQSERYFWAVEDYNLGRTSNNSNAYNGSVHFPVKLAKAPTLVSGSTFEVDSGSAGTPEIRSAASGFGVTANSVLIFNSAANWTTNAFATLTAKFNARL